jgi:hypothetical protein
VSVRFEFGKQPPCADGCTHREMAAGHGTGRVSSKQRHLVCLPTDVKNTTAARKSKKSRLWATDAPAARRFGLTGVRESRQQSMRLS